MVIVLDTDHLSLLQRQQQPECGRLVHRLNRHVDDTVCTTIVSFQEQILGWAAYLNRARKPAEVVRAYHELLLIERYFRDFELLPFDAASQARFESLRQSRIRIPTLDLRIACISLVRDATLLSRNLRDFRQVPGLKVEDWTS